MSVEIEFPFELVVEGTPLSWRAKRPESLTEWKARIVEASKAVLPEGHFATEDPLAVTLYYFPSAPMEGDIDNIVEPILDAMCKHIYVDDHQVERVLVQRFEPGNVFGFAMPTPTLGDALNRPKPTLYIRLSLDPFEDLI
jgi:crossover junction endodeoxyribonuclease RusA